MSDHESGGVTLTPKGPPEDIIVRVRPTFSDFLLLLLIAVLGSALGALIVAVLCKHIP